MIQLQRKIIVTEEDEKYLEGYFLTMNQLKELVRDFQADCHDGFVSNDNAYIEEWLKNMMKIRKSGNYFVF